LKTEQENIHGTIAEVDACNERCRQIAREMLFAFSQVKV